MKICLNVKTLEPVLCNLVFKSKNFVICSLDCDLFHKHSFNSIETAANWTHNIFGTPCLVKRARKMIFYKYVFIIRLYGNSWFSHIAIQCNSVTENKSEYVWKLCLWAQSIIFYSLTVSTLQQSRIKSFVRNRKTARGNLCRPTYVRLNHIKPIKITNRSRSNISLQVHAVIEW